MVNWKRRRNVQTLSFRSLRPPETGALRQNAIVSCAKDTETALFIAGNSRGIGRLAGKTPALPGEPTASELCFGAVLRGLRCGRLFLQFCLKICPPLGVQLLDGM